MSFAWADIAPAWRLAFAQPEIDVFLDEQLVVLLSPTASDDERAAARGSIETVLRLQSLPELARSREKKAAPVVESAQSWRQRLLHIIKTHYQE